MRKVIKILINNKVFRFFIVGCCATLLDFFIYILLTRCFTINISKTISMIFASIFSYIANKYFSFQNKDKINLKSLIRFYIIFLLNLVTNVSINYLFYGFTQNKLIAFIIATSAGMTVNYLGQRFFVFK